MATPFRSRPFLASLGPLPGLEVTTFEGLSPSQQDAILAATSKICRKLMEDLGVEWKPQPVDTALRQRTIDWIRKDLEPMVGPVNKRLLMSIDAGLTYTERVYEGGDFETRAAMVRYVSLAIYLDDMIDKNASMAKEAEGFLFNALAAPDAFIPQTADPDQNENRLWLDQYRQASVNLACHMSDLFVSNMLLHSCTLYIEGCALEYHIQRDQEKFFLVNDSAAERARDDDEKLARDRGLDIPLPLDTDRRPVVVESPPSPASASSFPDSGVDNNVLLDGDYLVPHGWPLWLRERSAVAETFAITSFCCAPDGVTLPAYLWVTAIPELRSIILSINDILSFPKELLANDTTSSLAVLTKERRLLGVPGTARDGGWCLWDSFEEVVGKILVAGARINRLLRPSVQGVRYDSQGRVYGLSELAGMLKDTSGVVEKGQVYKALALRLWETHQRGYVAWHFQSPRYRAHELFDWVRGMMGQEGKEAGPEWLMGAFPEV